MLYIYYSYYTILLYTYHPENPWISSWHGGTWCICSSPRCARCVAAIASRASPQRDCRARALSTEDSAMADTLAELGWHQGQ